MANEQGVSVTVHGQIDLSGVEFDPDVPLRLAAVREGEILASQDLKLAKTIRYEIVVPLPFPCGFRLLLGRADVPHAVFLASELAAVPVSPRASTQSDTPTRGRARRRSASEAAALSIEATPIAIDAARYKLWLGLCRRYRVHGRVVCRSWRWDGRFFRFCDDPVPAATVELYDVDRFWWFYTRDLIATATTGPDGTFDVEFWWCCPPSRVWWERPWVIDPDLLERIKRLVDAVRPRFPFPLPDPPPDPFELQQWVDTLGAGLEQPASAPTPAPTLAASSSAGSGIAQLLPSADLVAARVWPWWQRRDCSPDIAFRVTQECRGETRVIYTESNAQTRWDVPQDLDVTLLANEDACCIPICEDPPCGACVKFGQVGCLPVQYIGGNDPAVAVAADLLGLAYPGSRDIAFARGLSIDGVFGDTSDVDWYEIEYSRDGSPFQPLPKQSLGNIARVFWGPPCGGGPPQWNGAAFNVTTKQDGSSVDHFVYESRAHYEQGCGPGSWGNIWFPGGGRFWTTNRDRLLEWVTAATTPRGAGASPPDGSGEMTENLTHASLVDGLYRLRVVGWRQDAAGNLVDRRMMLRCDTNEEEQLIIRLDNRLMPNHAAFAADHPWGPGFVHLGTRDPDCDFVSIVKNEGAGGGLPVAPCDIVELDSDDTLTFHFFVTVPGADPDRHLGGYWMNAYYGESATFPMISAGHQPQADPDPLPGPTYADAVAQAPTNIRPWWGGGHYKLKLSGADFPVTCAYLFRLHAWKRVWSGCGPIEWFHSNDTEVSITIKKV